MSGFERFSLALLSCAVAVGLAGSARSEEKIDLRVAIFKALVRNEPLPLGTMASERAAVEQVLPCGELPPPHRARWEVSQAVRDASLRFAVPGNLIHSVIRQESAYDLAARSPVGAMGLMQLMPATARELGVGCPYDPRQNILGGTRYLREMHDRFGSWRLALAAYNAGPTAVTRNRIPGITRIYVRRVMAGWRGSRDGA